MRVGPENWWKVCAMSCGDFGAFWGQSGVPVPRTSRNAVAKKRYVVVVVVVVVVGSAPLPDDY